MNRWWAPPVMMALLMDERHRVCLSRTPQYKEEKKNPEGTDEVLMTCYMLCSGCVLHHDEAPCRVIG